MATKARKTPAQRRASDVASGRMVRGFWRSPIGENHGRDSRPGDVWCEPGDLTDTDRLNWLIAHSAYVAHARDGEVCWVMIHEETGAECVSTTPKYTPREAIDDAILSANVEMRDAPGTHSQRHSEHENTKR